MNKKRLAIFDLTDCEGCQIELISLGKKLLNILPYIEIVNWRLGQDRKDDGPYDIALVEGSPISQEEIDWLKEIREKSKILLALGTCATTAGIPGIIDKEKREFWYQKIYPPINVLAKKTHHTAEFNSAIDEHRIGGGVYGEGYKPRGIDVLPISAYVNVDFAICGCPIKGEEALRVLLDLLSGKPARDRGYSVCFECKAAQNPCLIINKKPCLGPITQGGCDAICVTGDSSCYGCFGIRRGANIDAMIEILKEFCSAEQIEQYFSMFLKRTEAYQKISNIKNQKSK